MRDPVIGRIAEKHGKTPAQTIIRWHIDSGFNVIPKTASVGRLPENIDVFDFQLDHEDMRTIETLDRPDGRIGSEPSLATPEHGAKFIAASVADIAEEYRKFIAQG